jgi:hypothetical protein
MELRQPLYTKARGIAPALVVLALLAALTGCASSRSPRPATSAPVPALGPARSVLTSTAASLRVDWYLTGAANRLTARCMQRMGFTYVTPDIGPEPSLHTITAYSLGTGHPATYGVTPESLADPPAEPDEKRAGYTIAFAGLSSQVASVTLATGDSYSYETGGCLADARKKLYGSTRAFVVSFYLVQDERGLFVRFTGTDRPYLSALHSWRACMKAAEFPAKSPEDAADSLQRLILVHHAGTAETMRRQTAMAEADTACDKRSRLRLRTNQALATFVGTLPRTVLAQLDDIAHNRARAYRTARQQ